MRGGKTGTIGKTVFEGEHDVASQTTKSERRKRTVLIWV